MDIQLSPIANVTDSATALLGVGEDIIDTLFTSDEERAKAKRELVAQVQNGNLKEARQKLEKLKTFAEDRASARKLYAKTRTWIVPFLAVLFTTGFFAVIFWVLYYGVPDGQSQVTWMLVGTLQTATITILSFFFGRTDREDRQMDFVQSQAAKRGGDLPNETVQPPNLDTSSLDTLPSAEIDGLSTERSKDSDET